MGFQSWVGTTSAGAPRARQFRDKKRENSFTHFQIWKICDKYENENLSKIWPCRLFLSWALAGKLIIYKRSARVKPNIGLLWRWWCWWWWWWGWWWWWWWWWWRLLDQVEWWRWQLRRACSGRRLLSLYCHMSQHSLLDAASSNQNTNTELQKYKYTSKLQKMRTHTYSIQCTLIMFFLQEFKLIYK